ncbi:MAG: hypothetical protein GX931_00510 [Acholeplasmataceae bacterium]|jgi:hypothetical protein|nr:hypothetical protein [Acholeplasmataceae bacterium]
MKKIRRLFLLIILFGITIPIGAVKKDHSDSLSAQTQIAPQYSSLISNRYTQKEEDLRIAVNEYIDLIDYELLGSVNNLSLYVKEEDLSFRVVNTDTGYLWGSNFNFDYLEEDSPLKDEGDLGANQDWKRIFNSPVAVGYYHRTNLREEYLYSNFSSRKSFKNITTTNKVGFSSRVNFFLSKINFDFSVYIDENGLHFEVPFDSITEGETLKLASIKLYPFFGAAKRNRIPGYVFIPDGMGALIRFDDDNTKGAYSKRFFGPDYGVYLSSNEKPLTFNTYGVVHGIDQNAFLGVVDEGASHAILSHFPSRTNTDFNHTYVTYEYRKDYIQYLNKSKTSSVNLVQEEKNKFDIKQSFYFLSGSDANYVGMANRYKEDLIKNGTLIKTNNEEIPIHFDVLMSESKKAFIGRKVFSMTKVSELEEIIKRLNEREISNVTLTLRGWQKGGYSYTAPSYGSVERKIGGSRKLKAFSETHENVYLEADYFKVSSRGSHYSKRDVGQSIGQELLSEDEGRYYFLRPDVSLKKYESHLKTMEKISDGTHLSSINYLYSEFVSNKNREQQIKTIKEFLEKANKTSVSKPFSYLLGADRITDVELYSSQQKRFSDTVPFMAIVLSGYKDVFGRNGNFFANTNNELLRLIDYHIYPSFYITNESSYYLLNTESEHIYTSRYLDWEEEIIRQYNYVNDALKYVLNESIVKREVLDVGFVKVKYSNGVIIYINYSGLDKIDGITQVAPTSYKVVL